MLSSSVKTEFLTSSIELKESILIILVLLKIELNSLIELLLKRSLIKLLEYKLSLVASIKAIYSAFALEIAIVFYSFKI